jgi:hypothetical protein
MKTKMISQEGRKAGNKVGWFEWPISLGSGYIPAFLLSLAILCLTTTVFARIGWR